MVFNFTTMETLLLITNLILIIIIVFLSIQLKKSKKKSEPEKEMPSSGSNTMQELKSDASGIKVPDLISPEETAEMQTGAGADSKTSVKEDLKIEEMLEETTTFPIDAESKINDRGVDWLKLEDEPPGEAPAISSGNVESGTANPEKARKPRRKKSKKKKASKKEPIAPGEVPKEETEVTAGKKADRKKKAVVQEGQEVETETVKEIVKEEKTEEKEPHQDSLF